MTSFGSSAPLAQLPWQPSSHGLAVSHVLGVVVSFTAPDSKMNVFALPQGDAASWFAWKESWTVAPGQGSLAALTLSGEITFVEEGADAHRPLLLVPNLRAPLVHVVDTSGKCEVGWILTPRVPHAVAAHGRLAAATSGQTREAWVYERAGAVSWRFVRKVGSGDALGCFWGIRFTRDGLDVVVVDRPTDDDKGRLSLYSASDGRLRGRLGRGMTCPSTLETFGDGWLVQCLRGIEFVTASGSRKAFAGGFDGIPAGMIYMPSHGVLAVQGFVCGGGCRLHVFASPDSVLMAAMSPARVAWMTACARALQGWARA